MQGSVRHREKAIENQRESVISEIMISLHTIKASHRYLCMLTITS